MKYSIWFQKFAVLSTISIIVFGMMGCFSRYTMKTMGLNVINIKERNLYVIDPSNTELTWLLSNVSVKENAVTAHFDKVTKTQANNLQRICEKSKKHKNLKTVLIYVNPETAKTYSDSLSTRLEFADISRIEVFRPDGFKVGSVLVLVGGSIAGFIGYISSFGD